MATIGVPVITAPGVPEDTSRPFPVRDPILSGVANSGVRFMFDLAFPWSYPGGPAAARPAPGAPSNAALVADMTEHADGAAALPAGAIAYAGGGFDFTNSQVVGATGDGSAGSTGVRIPASVLADIFTAFGGKSQRFMVVMYCKLPSAANWNASTSPVALVGDKRYDTQPSFIMIGEQNTGVALSARRQVAAATVETSLQLTPAAGDYGSVVQLAFWRNDTGEGFRLKSAAGTRLTTAALGSDNTQDFSANQLVFGRPNVFPASGLGVISAMSGFRLYRGWVENLARSGRDPVTVLDADYTAQQARNLFS